MGDGGFGLSREGRRGGWGIDAKRYRGTVGRNKKGGGRGKWIFCGKTIFLIRSKLSGRYPSRILKGMDWTVF